ncbi:MAG: preprotein translocase subunit SecA [Ruminococcaceae bacterium]|nr:preprotein translocase subunit SecA [Oscillospiraceae bacterium]
MGLFGTYSEKQVKKVEKIASKIEALASKYSSMTDEELKNTTNILRERIANGETLDDILPDAFAAVREADDRVLGKRPFHVQLIGGIILHQGRIAEMKTGEGKTLVETLPAYLNALTGKGVHIVTVNEYLARRDSEEMGRVYSFMGLTTGLVVHGQTPAEKQAAYNADITYGTNNEFGFDYLRDNMVVYKERLAQRGHEFAIIDEVDSILIDEARTPLIISGEGEEPTDMYDRADRFVRTLKKYVTKEMDAKQELDDIDADYVVDEKARNAILTPRGSAKAEAYFEVENYADPENAELAHYINQAIKAHGTMHRDQQYMVTDQGVMIVDEFTGRVMPGRRYSDGLHQAIEAKEGVKIEKENKTLATITFQNYFRLYKKLSGMTGTALTEDNEFREIYQLDVVEVPTNKPMIRRDHPDRVYKNLNGKYNAIIEQIRECHEKGQPVLVGTVSIEKSEELSRKLLRAGIPHTVLNAKYHAKEAEIVAQAGKLGAVTISTNMAGRGTDIMLGGNPEYLAKKQMRSMDIPEEIIAEANGTNVTDDPEIIKAREIFSQLYEQYKLDIAPEAEQVRAAGGLFILGTERHESRRIDNQLRGRSGRQGDPGESRFYLSLEDDLMRLFGSDKIAGLVDRMGLDENIPIDARILSNRIEGAQARIEDANFKRRKYVLAYDDVMNQQRTIIYKQRKEVLDGGDGIKETIKKLIVSSINDIINVHLGDLTPDMWDLDALRANLTYVCDENDLAYSADELMSMKKEDVFHDVATKALNIYAEKEALFGEAQYLEIQRAVLLRNVDRAWMEHIDSMDDLKDTIRLQSYAQRDPVTEYRIIGGDMFDVMIEEIREKTVRTLLTVVPQPKMEIKRVQVANPTTAGLAGGEKKTVVKKVNVPKVSNKVGRNEPCPCGSGKKYKNCCGAANGSAQ